MLTSPTAARRLHALTAAAAWLAVVMNVVLSGLGWYEETVPVGHLYGVNVAGWPGVVPRLADTLSYFTIWSNIVVAVSSTQLALSLRRTPAKAALRLAALLMITITAIVYAVLLAPTAHVTGWSLITNPLAHIVVPTLTVLSFLLVGPRGWIDPRTMAGALVIPLVWIAYMLVRGAIVSAYPYGFADVITHGYASVFTFIAGILAFALVLALVYAGIDRLLGRTAR